MLRRPALLVLGVGAQGRMKHGKQRVDGSTGHRPNAESPLVSTTSGGAWGGYLLRQRDPNVIHVKLTGCLRPDTVEGLHRRVPRYRSETGPTFVLLDASHLEHIPLPVIEALHHRVAQWSGYDTVALWVGLSPYLANLLVLAWFGEDFLPTFADLRSALRAVRATKDLPSGLARGRLAAEGGLRH